MRASRLLSILILLQLRVRLTAKALAEEFEVSMRTIYRDIDELSAAGIPVYGDRGPGGGFRLLDGYRTKLTGLAADETEAMFMAGMPEQAAALGLGAAAARAANKLLAALPSGTDAARMRARFHLDPVDWYREAEPVTHLPALARALLDQRVVVMAYNSWTTTRDWRIEPLGLVLKAGAWYLVANGHGKVRVFKVSNMLSVAVQGDHFEGLAGFDLAAYWAAELVRFEATLRPATALLRASPIGLKRISQQGAYAAAAVKAAEACADGWARFSLPTETIEQAALLLLGVGPEVEVLEPPALRARLHELAEFIAANARPQ